MSGKRSQHAWHECRQAALSTCRPGDGRCQRGGRWPVPGGRARTGPGPRRSPARCSPAGPAPHRAAPFEVLAQVCRRHFQRGPAPLPAPLGALDVSAFAAAERSVGSLDPEIPQLTRRQRYRGPSSPPSTRSKAHRLHERARHEPWGAPQDGDEAWGKLTGRNPLGRSFAGPYPGIHRQASLAARCSGTLDSRLVHAAEDMLSEQPPS